MSIFGHTRMQPIKVRSGPVSLAALAIVGIITVPLSGIGLYSALMGGGLIPLATGGALLVCFGILVTATLLARSRSVKWITSNGIEFADGTEAPWSALVRVVDRFGYEEGFGRRHFRTDLEFTGGRTAWLIPNRMSNFDDVYAIIMSADCEKAEVG